MVKLWYVGLLHLAFQHISENLKKVLSSLHSLTLTRLDASFTRYYVTGECQSLPIYMLARVLAQFTARSLPTGWMQVVILVYHVTGASESLPTYMLVRVLALFTTSSLPSGWMQVVILVYHVTGASQSLPIYMHVRLLVSAYLFLSGYGHFTRAWTSCRTEGVGRYIQVIYFLQGVANEVFKVPKYI